MTGQVGSARTHSTERKRLRKRLRARGASDDEITARIEEMRDRQHERRRAVLPTPRRPAAVPDIAPPAGRLAAGQPEPGSTQRRRVIARDGKWCRYCGKRVVVNSANPRDRLTIDHVTPRSRGGSNWATNRVVACGYCNEKKKDRTLEEWGRPLLPPRGPRAPR